MRRMLEDIKKKERGLALVETSIAMLTVLIALFGVIEVGRLLWTYNALADATRLGARWAVVNGQDTTAVQNMVLYGTTTAGTEPIVKGLTASNVNVTYSSFGIASGRATVTIQNFNFNFSVPLFGTSLALPPFTTTLTGEAANAPRP